MSSVLMEFGVEGGDADGEEVSGVVVKGEACFDRVQIEVSVVTD